MKVLHFCWEYPPRGSGIGQYIGGISAGLRALGHTSVVVTSRGAGLPEEEAVPGGFVHRIYDESEIGDPVLARRVLDLARAHGVDLIEAVDHLGEAAELLRLPSRPPVLVNCRYNDVLRVARYAQAAQAWQRLTIDLACLRDRRRIARERASIEGADLLAAPSARMLDELHRQGVRLPARTAVLPKPVTPQPEWRNAEAAAPTLLLVGRIDIGKGIQYLPDLLLRIAARFPEARLEIAGGDSYARFLGSMRGWLERRLGPLRERVRFLGHLAPAALDEAYRRAWVVLVPSRWDTSPSALLEAMVRGKAVVASPHGGMPEFLEGTEGRVADPAGAGFAEAVLGFLADATLRGRAGESVRRRADAYRPEEAARAYVAFVDSALGVPGGGAA